MQLRKCSGCGKFISTTKGMRELYFFFVTSKPAQLSAALQHLLGLFSNTEYSITVFFS